MSYLKVTPESVSALRNLDAHVEELHKDLLNAASTLITTFDENQGGLGAHTEKIYALLQEITDAGTNNGDVKKLVRRLRLTALNREIHIKGTLGMPERTPDQSGVPQASSGQSYIAGVLGAMYSDGYRQMSRPTSNGTWNGDTFHPDPEHIPQKFNPDGKSFRQITEDLHQKFGICYDGTPFVKGYADFSSVALARVDLGDVICMHIQDGRTPDLGAGNGPDFEQIFSNRSINFSYADQIAARSGIPIPGLAPGYTADDLAKWREKNRFTWDESHLNDYLLVPSEIHNNIPHTGLVGIGTHGTEAEQNITCALKKNQ